MYDETAEAAAKTFPYTVAVQIAHLAADVRSKPGGFPIPTSRHTNGLRQGTYANLSTTFFR